MEMGAGCLVPSIDYSDSLFCAVFQNYYLLFVACYTVHVKHLSADWCRIKNIIARITNNLFQNIINAHISGMLGMLEIFVRVTHF